MFRRGAWLVLVVSALGCAHSPRLALSTKLRLEADTHLFDLTDMRAEPDDWVVRVVGKGAACSGALVEPDVVLTAQHCTVSRDDDRVLYAPGDLHVELGGDYLPWGRVPVIANIPCPCWDRGGARGDIAALVLQTKLIGNPTRPARVDAGPSIGEEIAASGFGDVHGAWRMPGTDSSWIVTSVRRSTRPGDITQVEQGSFRLSGLSQPGDSGGPIFAPGTGEVIGVVARGTEGETRATDAHYTLAARLDVCAGVLARAHAIASGAPEGALPSVACR